MLMSTAEYLRELCLSLFVRDRSELAEECWTRSRSVPEEVMEVLNEAFNSRGLGGAGFPIGGTGPKLASDAVRASDAARSWRKRGL